MNNKLLKIMWVILAIGLVVGVVVGKFIGGSSSEKETAVHQHDEIANVQDQAQIWTCSMHPQIQATITNYALIDKSMFFYLFFLSNPHKTA